MVGGNWGFELKLDDKKGRFVMRHGRDDVNVQST